MRRIGIDCRFAEVHAGLGTYTRELVSALIPLLSGDSVTLFVRTDSAWLSTELRSRVEIITAPYAPYSISEQLEFPNLIQNTGIDLFYAPHFNVPLFLTVPFVCTVHDLILSRFPGSASFVKRLAYRMVLRRSVRRAEKIIAVSEYTKSDLVTRYGHSLASKTHVVYPGVSPVFSPQAENEQERVRSLYRLSHPFLLYVGGCKQHKNVPMLIDAFQSANLGEVDLVLIASGRECASLSRAPGVRFLHGVPEADMPALYSAALGSVTATLDEGFYLPGVEAMACGCPVLATHVGAIPEVLGDMALYTEPTVSSIADGMRRLISNPHLRTAEHVQKLKRSASRFPWNEAAEALRTFFA
jgi:glycosyltransferase involved in cell wall biosynthesis